MNPSSSSDKIDVVSGLGTTIRNVNASNQQLLQTAAEYADQGKQKANTVAKLNAYIKTTNSKLNDDINAYDAIVKKEGFANANPTMDAALEMSEIMSESQKYALVIFGAIAIFLLYKTMKHL
jgi:cysteinyl-tRNA synthetase